MFKDRDRLHGYSNPDQDRDRFPGIFQSWPRVPTYKLSLTHDTATCKKTVLNSPMITNVLTPFLSRAHVALSSWSLGYSFRLAWTPRDIDPVFFSQTLVNYQEIFIILVGWNYNIKICSLKWSIFIFHYNYQLHFNLYGGHQSPSGIDPYCW